MKTRLERLCTLRVTHTYYGGTCPDFAYTIPADTARALSAARLFAKTLDGQLVVAFEMNPSESGPRVEAAGTVLRFGLKLLNPDFANFTLLPATPADMTGVLRLYRNGSDANSLDEPDTLECTPGVFSVPLHVSIRPVTVTAVQNNAVLWTDEVKTGRDTATFDLRRAGPGRFEVRETSDGVMRVTSCYLDPEAMVEGLFGVVEIELANSFYANPPAFNVHFDVKDETLRYFVVASNYTDADLAQLSIQDSAGGLGFTKVVSPSLPADQPPPAARTVPGAGVVLFRSNAPVHRSATGGLKLQLLRNGEPIDLPLPGAASPTADLVVHLSKSKGA